MKASSQKQQVQSVADLFDLYANAVYGYLYRLSGDAALADELANETFYRAILALDGFRGDASVKTWLLKIARNLYLNHVKREKRMMSLDALLEKGITFRAYQPDPEAETVNRERAEALQRALLSLSETDRSILLLASQEQLPYQEIGQIIGISVAAVKVRIFRARQRLAHALEKENNS
jgi:RNA polymerase sigma-70 factor (ECF subfamily)